MATIQQYPLNNPALNDTLVGTKLPLIATGDPITSNFSVSSIAALANSINLGYTSYVATFSQSSTSDPVAVELSNTTGLTFTWVRVGPGSYQIIPSSSMVGGLWWNINGYKSESMQVIGKEIGSTVAQFFKVDTTTGVASDDVNNGNVEIRIY